LQGRGTARSAVEGSCATAAILPTSFAGPLPAELGEE